MRIKQKGQANRTSGEIFMVEEPMTGGLRPSKILPDEDYVKGENSM